MPDAIIELFRHHLWANEKLLTACETLADADLDATLDAVYGSIRQTLVHLFAAETRYLAAMRNEPRPNGLHEDQPFPGFADLRKSAQRTGAEFIALAGSVEPGARMSGENRGEKYDLPLSVPIAQTINHGTEHRTNVTTIMASRGLTAPQIDVWQYARERAANH